MSPSQRQDPARARAKKEARLDAGSWLRRRGFPATLGVGFRLGLAVGRRCSFPRSKLCCPKRATMGSRRCWRASRLLLFVGALACLAPAAAAHHEADEGDDLLSAFAFEEEDLTEFWRHRSASAAFYRSNKEAWRLSGCYIVVFKEETLKSQTSQTVKRLQARAAKHGYMTKILHIFEELFQGFVVKMSSDVLHMSNFPYLKKTGWCQP